LSVPRWGISEGDLGTFSSGPQGDADTVISRSCDTNPIRCQGYDPQGELKEIES